MARRKSIAVPEHMLSDGDLVIISDELLSI